MSQMPTEIPIQQPSSAPVTDGMPNVDADAEVPRRHMGSAKKLSEFLWDEYEKGKSHRKSHTRRWLMVKAIMRGIHNFQFAGGVLRATPRKPGVVRATVPIMAPLYRWEMGRLSANQIGVTATPRMGQGAEAMWRSDVAQAILTSWGDEIDLQGIDDEVNQHLCFYGMTGLYRYWDHFHKQVRLKPVAAPELHAIPYTARTINEADGLMRVQVVSRQWLEQQDDEFERQNPGVSFRKMANKATTKSLAMSENFPALATHESLGGELEGALVINFWMKPTEAHPQGQWGFLVEEELFRYRGQPSEDPFMSPLYQGKLPFELMYYVKTPEDFLGYGLCASLITVQREANRQMSWIIRSAQDNRAVNIYDPQLLDIKDIQDSISSWVPLRQGGYNSDDLKRMFNHIPAQNVGRDVGVVLNMVQEFAERAAGIESDVVFGKAEGRVEGGPANQMLNANAQTPLVPIFQNKHRAYARTYPAVLDMLREIWPPEKRVQTVGEQNIGKEMVVSRDKMPTSLEVVLTPDPMLPNGKNAMLQMLWGLRQMPSDDGKGFEVKSREFRRSLHMLHMSPPGLDLVDKREQRILWRVEMLINDGKEPAIPPALSGPMAEEMQAEDHAMSIEILKDKILDPAYLFYSQQVRQALKDEMKFHRDAMEGMSQPDAFDDAVERSSQMESEQVLAAAEGDLASDEGQLTMNSAPVMGVSGQ